MKNQNESMYKREFIPFDKDEIYAKKENDFVGKVQQYYNQYNQYNQQAPNNVQKSLQPLIQGLEKVQNRPKTQLEQFAESKINDLSQIKNDYLKSGGNDPYLVQNIDNLQRFYQTKSQSQQQQQQQQYQPNIIQQQQQYQYQQQQNQNNQLIYQNNIDNNKQTFENDSLDKMIQQKIQQIQLTKNKINEQKQKQNQYFNQNINQIQNQEYKTNQIQQQQQQIQQQQQQYQQQQQQQNYDKQPNSENPFSIFTIKNEFFLHNEVRSVDLDKEERTIMNISQQEIDDLRVLSRIPVGTELYRFKMEQYKQLSTTRAEIEKIVQEQRLAKMRRKFELERKYMDRKFDNQRWIDDQRRWILASKIRNEQENTDEVNIPKDYDTNQGFLVHWDYILGLPRRISLSQIVFGIYTKNQTIFQPKLVDPHDTEIESAQTVRCIIGDQNQIFDIPADPETLIIMEVQIPQSKNLQDNIGRTDTFGWTQVDLFDYKRTLKRGKFKCPLYYGPTEPQIPIPEIKYLEPIPGAWIYFRIAYPNDAEYGQVQSLYPDQTMYEYIIPQIHLRNITGARQDILDIEGEPEPLPNITYQINNSQIPQPGHQNQQNDIEPKQIPQLKYYNPQQKPKTISDKSETPDNENFGGLAVIIKEIQNHVAGSHCRVQIALLEDNYVIQDKNGLNCTFNTSIHNPLDNKFKYIPQKEPFDLDVQNPHMENMNNKEQGQNIMFNERYKFLQNIIGLYKQNKKDIWLAIQVVEKPIPVQLQDDILVDTALNYAGLDYEPIGWNFFKVIEGGKLRKGEQKIILYEPPIRRPPVDLSRVKQLNQRTQVIINLEKLEFTDKDLKYARDATKKKKSNSDKSKLNISLNQKSKSYKNQNQNQNPFIQNNDQQWNTDSIYTKNMGIDFYIDGLRHLPDKVTVTKIIIDVVNIKYQTVFEQESCLPELNSTQYNPVFNYRRELRKNVMDPTSLILLTTVTYDNASKKSKCVGYSGIQLFINPYTKEQPQDQNENEFCIYEGYYQLPIYSQQIEREYPFNINQLQKLERIPCASILVRLKKAALSDDGLRCLSIKEFPQKDWISKGLVDPQPEYSAGKQKGMEQFLDQVLKFGPDTQIIDMMYFAKYDQKVGINFSLDGLNKVPNSKWIYSGLISLFPPGNYYLNSVQQNQDQIQMISQCDLLSPAESPRFKQGFISYTDQPFDRYLSIIVDIKALQINKNEKKLQNIGWTLVPLFSPDGYALSKVFQLPLIKGEVNPVILQEMNKRDPWDVIQEKLNQKNSKFKLCEEYTSIMVRVVDAQREGHFQIPYDLERLDYRYLPEDQKKRKEWAYTKATELYLQNAKKVFQNFSQFKTIPNDYEQDKFNQQITFDFGSALGIEKYFNQYND
ncbi:hypothetical protein IMG5_101270 [Ichthyophthirius multifiliis]|uniref:Uncharacterized protein n=1 Tax=Ichthyophthirius multifiliis TaxID=5932 RepID=G0QSI5_ICHMU|nr:hypothetical protein IMG5_101270 [Ichthyophthirius multifiliis]EGR31823.1 hypothetical protein IMG5_101270 [Ichthyophthirius multifiliis]|eukprot:XP_004035309.1 hypothetical protein IMG5_101270 [Ichthyophthirius multifiliis]